LVLWKGAPDSYDGRCLATGSVLRFNDRYWLAYTGNWNDPQPTAALAVSDDLYHWEKLANNPITHIDPTYYDDTPRRPPRDWLHWRDPFLFEHDGFVYHYVCANANKGPIDERGTLAGPNARHDSLGGVTSTRGGSGVYGVGVPTGIRK
jgi:beta-fructofuranosidase